MCEMRSSITLVAGLAIAASSPAKEPLHNWPFYESVEDPPGQQPRRILVDDNTFAFGQAGDTPESVVGSDLGFSLYFVRVDGGVRVSGQPLIFPDGTRKRLDFEDFSCSASRSGSTDDVVCRNKSNGQLYHSRLVGGGLVAFDIRCSNELERVCHFRLIGGRPIRPSKVRKTR